MKQPQARYGKIVEAKAILNTLSHDLRMKILATIEAEKEMSVTPIYKKLKIEQSVASQHLALLKKAGFVTANKVGRYVMYSVNRKRINEIAALSEQMVK